METGETQKGGRTAKASWQAALFLTAAAALIVTEQWTEHWLLPNAAAATAIDQLQAADPPANRLRTIDATRQWLPMATASLIVVIGILVFAPKPRWRFNIRRLRLVWAWRLRQLSKRRA